MTRIARFLGATLLFIAAGTVAAAGCETHADAAKAEASIGTTFQAIKADQSKREAEIGREMEVRAKALNWSQDRRMKFWTGILSSPQFAAFEAEKRPLTQELMTLLSSPPDAKRDPKGMCAAVKRLEGVAGKIRDVNVRQYGYMLAQVKAAK